MVLFIINYIYIILFFKEINIKKIWKSLITLVSFSYIKDQKWSYIIYSKVSESNIKFITTLYLNSTSVVENGWFEESLRIFSNLVNPLRVELKKAAINPPV